MLTPEQMAEYQTERKALAMLKRGLYPEKLADNEFVVRVWNVEGWFDGGYAGECPTPALALAAAYDALEVEAEECPVVAAYKEALPPADRLELVADWIDHRFPDDANPEVQKDLRTWARNIRAALAVKECQ